MYTGSLTVTRAGKRSFDRRGAIKSKTETHLIRVNDSLLELGGLVVLVHLRDTRGKGSGEGERLALIRRPSL